jgi:nitrate/nitrite-specific signal transduction histidine kinase
LRGFTKENKRSEVFFFVSFEFTAKTCGLNRAILQRLRYDNRCVLLYWYAHLNGTMHQKQTSEAILKQLRQVATMVMQAAEADTMEQMLQNIADVARELIGARYAALGVPDERGGLKHFKVSGMNRAEIRQIAHPPVGLGLLGSILRDAEPLRLEHMREHPEAVGFPQGHPHMESLMGVPIKLGEQLYGIFYLTDKEDGSDFSEDDQWLLEILSGYAALVIAEKHLQDQRRQLTVMREREQIAMALHDGVIQSIYALGMRLDLAQRNGQVTSEDVGQTLEGLNHVIEDIRSAIFQLKDNHNEALTLRRRFQHILSQLYIPKTIEVILNLPEHIIPLPEDILATLEMMINECLSNVVRHANATQIDVTVKDIGSHVEVTITDNGDGFEAKKLTENRGLGLRNLERRARMYGGTVQIHSQLQNGTVVDIRLPIE